MFKSIYNDIKGQFNYGNNVTRLLLINVIVFVVLWIIYAFIALTQGPGFMEVRNTFRDFFTLPPSLLGMLKKPWTIFTHMFLHESPMHLIGNMIGLYIFGRIFGDLLGDRRVVPLYILGGLMGILFIQLAVVVFKIDIGHALGASAAVMAIVVASAIIAPNYEIRLILFGNVKIKYIALVYIIFDIIGLANLSNTGGHFAHIGGMLMGWFYILMIQANNDPAVWMNKSFDSIKNFFSPKAKPQKKEKSPLSVKYKATVPRANRSNKKASMQTISYQEKLDAILEKISKNGIASLSKEEKEFLDKASKNN